MSSRALTRLLLQSLLAFVVLLSLCAEFVLAEVLLPKDYPPPSLAAPSALRDVGDYFGPVERRGNLLTTSTEWSLDTYLEGELNLAIRQALTEAVIADQGDRFDFVMVMTTFPTELRTEELAANGMYWHVSNSVEGIGLPSFDYTSDWGSSGHLQGFIDLGHAHAERLFPQSNEYQDLLVTVMHELMHRWSSFVRYIDDSGSVSQDLLGHADSHWSSLVHSQASVMYGHEWVEKGGSEYLAGPILRRYSDLDMYLAGLAGISEVPPILRLRNPTTEVPEFPKPGQSVQADAEFIPVERIVDAEGPRLPNVVDSEKHFRAAFVLVTRPEESLSPGLLASVERLRRDVQSRFSSMVGGRAILHIVPEPLDSAGLGTPRILEGSSQSNTPSVDTELALDWLEQAQGPDGFWSDRNGSRWRDTASAIGALRSLRPGSDALPPAESILNQADPNTLEAFSWRARALPGGVGKSAAMVEQVLALQRPDGGWGLTVQHESSVEDTAGILRAFWDVLPNDASHGAYQFIAAARNADGGWGSFPGASTHFPPSLSAIEVLSLPIFSNSEVLSAGRDWLASRHRASGEFRHAGETFSPGDTARALALLIGQDVDPAIFDSTTQWLARRQGADGDWAGSAFSTAEVVRVLGLLELPNLQVMGQPWAEPEAPVVGSMVRLTARIANTGRQTAPASSVQWYLGDPRVGGSPISGPIAVPELTSGSSLLVEYVWETATPQGEQDIWVVADGGNGLEEWTLEDNYGQLPLLLTAPPEGPELALHADAVSVSPASIDSIPTDVQVTGTLWNHGSTAVADAVLALFDVGDAAPSELVVTSVDVPAGGEVAFDLSFEYDGSQSSQLRLVADPDDLVADADRGNNEIAIDLNVSTGIDVAVEAVTLKPEEAPYAGHPLKISVDIANRGLAAAPSFRVLVEVLDDSGQLVHETETSLSLDSLVTTSREFDWQPASPGTYTLLVSADPDGLLDDVDPLNNELEAAAEVTAAEGINLRIDPLSVVATPDPGLEGASFNVSAVVGSDGGDAAPAFSVGLFDGDPRDGGQLLGDVGYEGGLAPGQSANLNIEIEELPLRGVRTLWLHVDHLHQASETDELDNLYAFDHEILSLPDLMVQVSDFSIDPAVPVPGEPVTLEARVNNLGGQPAENVRVDLLEVGRGGQTLIESRNLEEVSEEGFATLSWSWTLGTQDGLEGIQLVVDPDDVISEQSVANNQAELGLGTGEGPLFATNQYFSPNGDEIKDDTLLVFRLEEAQAVELVIERPGEVVRRLLGFSEQPVDRGQIRWDGRNESGVVVPDGDYLVRLRHSSGNKDLATTIVTVDTDRSSLARANQFGRVFENRIEGFRQYNGELLPISDPELGLGYAIIDPYSTGLEVTVAGVYKTAVRTLEPVISDQWIQAHAGQSGQSVWAEELAYDGVNGLAVLAEGSNNDEIWLADLGFVDSVEVFELSNSDSNYRLLGFGPGGHVVLSEVDWRAGIERFVALDRQTGQILVSDSVDWNSNSDQYALMTKGVLVHSNRELVFADFAGGVERYDFGYPYWRWSSFEASESGELASVHIQTSISEAVVLFRQDQRLAEEVRYADRNFPGSGPLIKDSAGNPVQIDDLALGTAWSPQQDTLAILDARSRELVIVTSQGEMAHPLPASERIDYAEELLLEGGRSLVREGTVRSVQKIATRLGELEFLGGGDEQSLTQLENVPLGMVEGESVSWNGSGDRLMFSTSELVVALDEGASEGGNFVFPGASELYVFDRSRLEFELVTSGSAWPLDGETMTPLPFEESWQGLELQLVEPFEIPRFFWWSAHEPQRWIVPPGPFYVEEYWPDEAGYSLAQGECTETSEAPWNSECLPIPVVNLDTPTKRLTTVVATEDLDLGGFATDRNLQAWRIDVSAMDGLASWQPVASWTTSEVIDARFLRWPPDVSGPVLLRLELIDKAGNRHLTYRRVILPADPLEPVIELTGADPRLISPNGDGIQDAVTLEYESLLAEPFQLRVLDGGGTEVFSEVVSHLPGELGLHTVQWSGESNAGPIVPDGEYSVEIWRYSVPVVVDNSPPAVEVTQVIPPYVEKPPRSGGLGDSRPAMVSSDISDASISQVILESRRRGGSLSWSKFRGIGDWTWIGLSPEDYAERAFRIRAEDSAGNVTYSPIPWPGDHLMLMGAKDHAGEVFPDPDRRLAAFDPSAFNNESNTSISWEADLSLNGAESLQLDVFDLSLDRVDDLHVEFRGAGQSEWQSFEVEPDGPRDGWAALPFDQIPSARMEVRLRSGASNLTSNIAALDLSYTGMPQCLSAEHESFFENANIAADSDDMLVFWHAFSSPAFQVRELRRIRPGQSPEVLEPVMVGLNGAQAFLLPDVGDSEETFVYQIRYQDGTEERKSVSFGCNSTAVPMPACFDSDRHSEWFSGPMPEIDPLTHSRIFWQPHPSSEYPVANMLAETAGDDQLVDPVMTGSDGARLYLLEKDSTYRARIELAGSNEVHEQQVFTQCADHIPTVRAHTLPAQECGSHAGAVRISVFPPTDPAFPVNYANVRSELRTIGGNVLEVLFDESNPVPFVPGDSSCARPEVLARGEVGLEGLAPGTYKIVTRVTSDQGNVWEDVKQLPVYAQPAAQSIDAPQDQALVCVSDAEPEIGVNHRFLDARFAPVIVEAWGHPAVVGQGGYGLEYAEAIQPDSSSLTENAQGECAPWWTRRSP